MKPQRPHRSAGTIALLGIAALCLLTACAGAAGPNTVASGSAGHASGFLAGLWHGVIMPVTFVVSLFSKQVNIYDVHNDGAWYNFGFVLGAGVLLGGGGRGGRGVRSRRRSTPESSTKS